MLENESKDKRVVWIIILLILLYQAASCIRNFDHNSSHQKENTGSIHNIRIKTPGHSTAILLEKSNSISDITIWVNENIGYSKFITPKPDADGQYFVILYDIGSGIYVMQYIVYFRPNKFLNFPPEKWYAIAQGHLANSSESVFYIKDIYLKEGNMIFVDNHGKVIKSVILAEMPGIPKDESHP